MKYLPLFLLLTACANELHVSSDPVAVIVKLDMSSIMPYCQDRCKADPAPNTCIDKCVSDFLAALAGIAVKT